MNITSLLYLALSTRLFENVLTFDNEKWAELKTDFFLDLQKSQNDEYFKIHNSFIKVLNSSFLNQLNSFCSSFTYQAKYFYRFMNVFEILILFIQASRQKDWKVVGGVIGLTQNQAALNQFCLSAPILSC